MKRSVLPRSESSADDKDSRHPFARASVLTGLETMNEGYYPNYWFEPCTAGRTLGCGNRGRAFLGAIGVAKNERAAAASFETGCAGGDGVACAYYATLFRDGRGVDKSDAFIVSTFH